MTESTVATQSFVDRRLAAGDVAALKRGQIYSTIVVSGSIALGFLALALLVWQDRSPAFAAPLLAPAIFQYAGRMIRAVRDNT